MLHILGQKKRIKLKLNVYKTINKTCACKQARREQRNPSLRRNEARAQRNGDAFHIQHKSFHFILTACQSRHKTPKKNKTFRKRQLKHTTADGEGGNHKTALNK